MKTNGLKAGDEIAVFTSSSWGGRMITSKIAKVTPTGRVTLINSMKFNPEGVEMGDHYHHSYLATMEDYNAWKAKDDALKHKNVMVAKARNIRFEYLDAEQLEQILKIANVKDAE